MTGTPPGLLLGDRGMLSLPDYMRLHVESAFTHDADGQLHRVNEPTGGPAPRFFLGHTVEGLVLRFRHDVPEVLRRELQAAASTLQRFDTSSPDVPLDPTPFAAILARAAPVERTWAGLAFRFPVSVPTAPGARLLQDSRDAALLHALLPEWTPDVDTAQPLIAFVIDGQAVAVCGSVRITPYAHQAGVETAAEWRGRGHAGTVVSTWAAAVRDCGAEPIYSTSWDNAASRSVARKLGLVRIGRDLHIT